MLIVAGHLELDPRDRDAHVAASRAAVALARSAPGCFDFAVSADALDPGRVNVFERWATQADLDAFRASGDQDDAPDFSRIHRFCIEQFETEGNPDRGEHEAPL